MRKDKKLSLVEVIAMAVGLVEVIVIAFFISLNFFGSRAVGKAEFYIVFIKLSILLVSIFGGFLTIKWNTFSFTVI